jgi:hypothetical protein
MPEIIVARNASGRRIGVGPFKSRRSLETAKNGLPHIGWSFEETLLLIPGSDMQHEPETALS